MLSRTKQIGNILQCRTAFAIYEEKGIEEVGRVFPSSVDFVNQHKDKTLNEVTELLTQKLNKLTEKLDNQSENLILA